MGTYADFYIDKTQLFATKSVIDPTLLSLYLPQDLVKKENYCAYINTAEILLKRLDIMGFTNAALINAFNKTKNEYITYWLPYNEDEKLSAAELEHINIAELVKACLKIVSTGNIYIFDLEEEISNCIVKAFFESCRQEDEYYEPNDIRYLIRAYLSVMPLDSIISYDITNLIDGEFYNPGQPIHEQVIIENNNSFSFGEKIIVLTEGKTDSDILSQCMNILYPDLSGYYYFMDFYIAAIKGGAPLLVHTVKSFISAGIKNKVIAIFDNDTAASETINSLNLKVTPPNIVITKYPDIEIANCYPTKLTRDAEIKYENINGSGCCLELYFGKDVLEYNGNLLPVADRDRGKKHHIQWGFEAYQKKDLQKRFDDKLKNQRLNPQNNYDLSDIDKILNTIFTAFSLDKPITDT